MRRSVPAAGAKSCWWRPDWIRGGRLPSRPVARWIWVLCLLPSGCYRPALHQVQPPVANQRNIGGYDPLTTLAERLVPGDTSVVVDNLEPVSLAPEDTSPEGWLRFALQDSPQAFVIDIRSISSILTDGGRWMNIRVSGNIVESLKASSNDSRPQGEPVSFGLSGGELVIEGVVVRMTHSPSLPTQGRLLVFLGDQLSPASGLLTLGPVSPVLVERERLASLPGQRNPIAEMTMTDVRRLAKQVK